MEAANHLLDLSNDLLSTIVSHLTHFDRHQTIRCTCTLLRSAVSESALACTVADVATLGARSNELIDRRVSYCARTEPDNIARIEHIFMPTKPHGNLIFITSILRPLINLESLSLCGLQGFNTAAAEMIAKSLPSLRTLDLSETTVATRGVVALRALPALEELQIVYCPLVCYAAVLALRAASASPRLRLIRRQPRWLDGHFDTPWGEVHTYWPCGAFYFAAAEAPQRRGESKGYVAQMRPRARLRTDALTPPYEVPELSDETVSTSHVEDRLIFIDIDPSQEPASSNGRIGVQIAPDNVPGRVIVVQSLETPEPPPRAHAAITVGFGVPDVGQTTRFGNTIVSCIAVRPLRSDEITPPPALQSELRAFCFGAAGAPQWSPLDEALDGGQEHMRVLERPLRYMDAAACAFKSALQLADDTRFDGEAAKWIDLLVPTTGGATNL